jgi:hypothetical protein
MSFFSKVDALGIAEKHIQKVYNLEEKEANYLIRQYKGIRTDLRDRLESMPEDTFNTQRLKIVMHQVNAAINAQEKKMKQSIQDSGDIMALEGVDDLVKEINYFEEEFNATPQSIDVNSAAIASDANNLLISKYDESISAYSADQKERISKLLTQAVVEGMPYSEVVKKLGEYQLGEEWKIQRLARTELHNIYSQGKLMGMREVRDSDMPDLKKALMHPLDARTGADSKYLADLNPIMELDEPFSYKWKGSIRTFMTPPDRPNDRAILIPYREEWGSDNGAAFLTVNAKKRRSA